MGHAVSLTLDKDMADPNEKGRGWPQAGAWVLTVEWSVVLGWLQCLAPLGSGPLWSDLSSYSLPGPQKAETIVTSLSTPEQLLHIVLHKYLSIFFPLVQFNSKGPLSPFFLFSWSVHFQVEINQWNAKTSLSIWVKAEQRWLSGLERQGPFIWGFLRLWLYTVTWLFSTDGEVFSFY